MIEIYTDGSTKGNPGRGGFGSVIINGTTRVELKQGYKFTTNNRMEIMGVIAALEHLQYENPLEIKIYSDSQYVVNTIQKGWLKNWAKSPTFQHKKNKDLWLYYLELAKNHNIEFIWVKGHANNVENNYCDMLANQAALSDDYVIDVVYEQLVKEEELK